ncbi:3-dehydroquinate dehydratase [Pandoraea terrae]|uniref:3-dehydroquinate dehydratase n=1 Tax=Pandoraea terrae TaxID=1537710 RepID=A0A5E4SBJ3_9BURK|nr:type II 3-dehydroquinate dehydratase [Pandoraea terrae]VVD72987.1 3-dehydroquinate dehydratase [Pandoraea terrae]
MSNRTKPSVWVLNGPNLNLLGTREPAVYGAQTLADIEAKCRNVAQGLEMDVRIFQSNAEHQLIDWIHAARLEADGIVINPAAYTHTSVAIADALRASDLPIVEVHLSNVHQREVFRHRSYVSPVAKCVICGCGSDGYEYGLRYLAKHAARREG